MDTYLLKRSIFVVVCILIACATLFVIFRNPADANVYILYASSCLGGWENTAYSAGPPEVKKENTNNQVTFSQDNSAVLAANAYSEIYCGGFSGPTLQETIPKKIQVMFSWKAELPEDLQAQIYDDEVTIVTSASTTHITEEMVDDNATSTTTTITTTTITTTQPETNDIPSSAQVIQAIENILETHEEIQEAKPEPKPEPESESENIESEVLEVQTNEVEQDSTEAQTTNSVTEEDTASETPVPAEEVQEEEVQGQSESIQESEESSEPVSWLHYIIQPVFAEENTSSTTLENNTVAGDTHEQESVSYGLVEIVYTLNGQDWISLAEISEDEFDSTILEIPIDKVSDWNDISKIQIGIRKLPQIHKDVPVIYLDSVWLNVEYSNFEKPIEELFASSTQGIIKGQFNGFREIEKTYEAYTDENTVSYVFNAHSIKEIKTISPRFTALRIITGEKHDVWLVDTELNEVALLTASTSLAQDIALGSKEGKVFWVDYQKKNVVSFDPFNASSTLHTKELHGYAPERGQKGYVNFESVRSTVIVSGNSLYFYTPQTGEVFSDDMSTGLESFVDKYSLRDMLNLDEQSSLGLSIQP